VTQELIMNTANKLTTFDPHATDFLENPFPTYARFRAEQPIAYVTPYQSWWCFRYRECEQILSDDKTFIKNDPLPPASIPPLAVLSNQPKSVFAADNPEHDQIRPILDRLLAKAIEDADAITTGLAEQLLVKAKASARFELINTFATPLPAGVLQQILGVAKEDLPTLTQWVQTFIASDDIAAPLAVKGAGLTCALALGGYFDSMARCPMHQQQPKSMFELMQAEVLQGSDAFKNDDLVANARTLMIAGYASTTFLIGSGTVRLTQPENQGQLELLRCEPERMDDAVREMLRIDSPVQLIDRYVTREISLGDVSLRPGDKVTAVIGSANHDETVFTDPDRFDITRPPRDDFGFGMGIHRCLGAPLAKKVTSAAFRVLLAQLPKLRLEGRVAWQSDPFLRAPATVPIAFG
jgi:cytochrome P450